MSTEFGWWHRDPEAGKFQVRAAVHGGNISWARKQGHHTSWEEHRPSAADWERLLDEAGRRVPRRLLSPRQFEAIRLLRERAGSC
ncbi:MAG: hypothetical protein ACREFX_04245 [Opitutaceae bacterium]